MDGNNLVVGRHYVVNVVAGVEGEASMLECVFTDADWGSHGGSMVPVVEAGECGYVLLADFLVPGVLIHCETDLIAIVVGRPMAVEWVGAAVTTVVIILNLPWTMIILPGAVLIICIIMT